MLAVTNQGEAKMEPAIIFHLTGWSLAGLIASVMFVVWIITSIREERGYTPRRRKG